MKWMGCLNHDLQHNPSEKPRKSPTTAFDCETQHVRLGLHPDDCQPQYKMRKHIIYVWSESGISMKGMGGPNHILQHVPSEKPRESPTTACDCETQHIRLGLHPDDCQPQYKMQKHTICIQRRSDESMRRVECLNHNIQHDTSQSPTALTLNPITYHAGVASLWPLAAVAGAETHDMYTNLIFYEYEVDGMPQSWPTASSKWETKRITYNCLWLWDPAYQAGVTSWWLPAAV
jgi:hypothetical protein